MCGRVTLTALDPFELAKLLDAALSPQEAELYTPHPNGAPTDVLWTADRGASFDGPLQIHSARWGIPKRDNRGVVINARSETANVLPMFREAWVSGRTLIAGDGFFEWKSIAEPGARRPRKQAFHFHQPNRAPFWFAGLKVKGRSRQDLDTFVILTRAAEGVVSDIHDRMPVMMKVGEHMGWLDGAVLPPALGLACNEVESPTRPLPAAAAPTKQLKLF